MWTRRLLLGIVLTFLALPTYAGQTSPQPFTPITVQLPGGSVVFLPDQQGLPAFNVIGPNQIIFCDDRAYSRRDVQRAWQEYADFLERVTVGAYTDPNQNWGHAKHARRTRASRRGNAAYCDATAYSRGGVLSLCFVQPKENAGDQVLMSCFEVTAVELRALAFAFRQTSP